jgi:IgA Peptidase M64/Secretion system C-terminal sorting domain
MYLDVRTQQTNTLTEMNLFSHSVKNTFFFLVLFFLTTNSMGQKYRLDTLLYNGNSSRYINIVILGDGYTTAELVKYKTDASGFMNDFLFSQSPYKEYKAYFNVFTVEVPSPESGVKHPRTASDCSSLPASNPNNFFGSSFDIGGIHRLLSPNSSKVTAVLANNFPAYDQVYMIANSSEYGGAGGTFATFSTNTSSGEIGLHEGGHSFGNLADEYWAGSQYAMEKPNMTKETSPTLVKWRNWMNVNGVGINPHTGDASWKKPRSGQCKMEVLGKPFCSVCTETLVEKIHSLVHVISNYNPVSSAVSIANQVLAFSITYMQPSPNTISSRWILDGSIQVKNNVSILTWTMTGTQLGKNQDGISLDGNALSMGTHTLKVYIVDTTNFTRSDVHPNTHLDSIMWIVNKTPTGINICQNDNWSLKLFPNPVSDEPLNILYSLPEEDKVLIEILAVDGKTVRTFQQKAGKGEHTQHIDLGNLPSGNYFVRLSTRDFVITQETIKK